MKKRDLGNLFLHIGGGALIAAAIMWIHWLSFPALLIVGFVIEKGQHRWILTVVGTDSNPPHGKLYLAEKRKPLDFGWVTKRSIIEAGCWGGGALIASVVWCFI